MRRCHRILKSAIFVTFFSLLWSCSKEYDLTITEKTIFEGDEVKAIATNASWEITVISSDNPHTELQYSKCLEESISANLNNGRLDLGLSSSTLIPAGSSMKAVVYTNKIEEISLNYGSTAKFDGHFSASSLIMKLVGSSSCKALDITVNDSCTITLDGVSVVSGCNITCNKASIVANNSSHIAGTLAPTDILDIELNKSSRFVNYQSGTPLVKAKLTTASLMNIAQTVAQNLYVEMSASTASANVAGAITGTLSEASSLYYTGDADITGLELLDTSVASPL